MQLSDVDESGESSAIIRLNSVEIAELDGFQHSCFIVRNVRLNKFTLRAGGIPATSQNSGPLAVSLALLLTLTKGRQMLWDEALRVYFNFVPLLFASSLTKRIDISLLRQKKLKKTHSFVAAGLV